MIRRDFSWRGVSGVALFVAMSTVLAGCGGSDGDAPAETQGESTAPARMVPLEQPTPPVEAAPAPPPVAEAVPPAAAEPAGDVVHALILGEWSPTQAQCRAGNRLSVGATRLTNTTGPERACDILAAELEDGVLTVVGTCDPVPGILEDLTFALAAEIVDGAPPATMEMIQGGLRSGQPFTQPNHLVRCTP